MLNHEAFYELSDRIKTNAQPVTVEELEEILSSKVNLQQQQTE
ncbi:hypothetical protein [Nostoc sp. ChiQUE01b]|nr:hypothetical protein [Nostoc sp. ChiQUE01b]MDZ8262643.1 hypothetical protein [Nostoc sp. ChiQUE01b]